MSNNHRKRNRKSRQRRDQYQAESDKAPTQPVAQTTVIQPDISQGFSAIVQQAFGILVNSDIAVRTDERLQRQMIRDPMIMAPLTKRMLATAQLDWQIVPPDADDPRQVEVAEFIDQKISEKELELLSTNLSRSYAERRI